MNCRLEILLDFRMFANEIIRTIRRVSAENGHKVIQGLPSPGFISLEGMMPFPSSTQ